ncbi:MAG: TetR/AcrR family transcriptional regulator [Nitrospirota bacterium]|jgi:AcrR family transcriptional regulator
MTSAAKVKGDVRRRQVVEATLRLVAKGGLRSLTTAGLAKEVGMSEANLYRHFRGKDEIIRETVDSISEGLIGNMEKVIALPGSPLMKLKKAFMLHLEYIQKNEGIPRLVFSEELHGGNEKLKKKLLKGIDSYASALESIIKDAQKESYMKKGLDPKASALSIIGMVQGVTLRWSLSGYSFSLTREGMKLWRNYETCVRIDN